ncbi:MAG: DUF559 domain-containing protein [Solirubrobacterales bacterium]
MLAMASIRSRSKGAAVWRLARAQHGVVTRAQLRELGLGRAAIEHRLRRGRLHRIHLGVYAVGRPELTRHGRRMAAVLNCGPGAALSHLSAAELWGIVKPRPGPIHVSLPSTAHRRPQGITVHRRRRLHDEVVAKDGIPITSPTLTLIDIAATVAGRRLEAAVNEADKLDLVDPESLRAALERHRGQRGVTALRRLLDRRTFRLTDSELERRFLGLVRRARLPLPMTGQHLNGFRVDFFWPELDLVVETDGLRYHRTPAEQVRDRIRDQTHTAAGLTCLRFTHSQVRFDPETVVATLRTVMLRRREAA